MLAPILVKLLGSTKVRHIVQLPQDDQNKIGAFGVDGDGIVPDIHGTIHTWNEIMVLEGMTPETMAQTNTIEITEEEFINKTFE